MKLKIYKLLFTVKEIKGYKEKKVTMVYYFIKGQKGLKGKDADLPDKEKLNGIIDDLLF